MFRIPAYARQVLLLSLLLSGGVMTNARSQTAAVPANNRDLSGRWGLGLQGGMMKLVEGEWDYSTVEAFGGVSLNRGLSPQWNLALALKYGLLRPGAEFPGDEVGLSGASSAPLYTSVLQPTLKLQHRFSAAAKVSPVLGVGLGLTKWHVMDKTGEDVGWFPSGDAITGYDTDGNATTLEGTDFTLLMELGLDLALNESLRLNLGASYDIMPGNDKDNVGLSSLWGPDHVDANTALVSAHIGLTWWFGSGDRDGDGVPNDMDQCPDAAEDRDGYNDTDGCPDPDNDQDGILDADDACPTLAEDRDGFQDTDGCPDPDNDRDGINDGRDLCPDEAEDIDGWEDQDGCPDPDNDQDGVPDERDKCPRTPADSKVDAAGCAVEVPAATAAAVFVPAQAGSEVLEGVNFVSGSAELTPESITRLIDLANELGHDPAKHIEIRGHTDATGDAAANLALSQRRAESVRASLIQMGIAAERLTAVGYGEEFPIADNATPAGRALNRRVEIHRQ